MTDLPLKLIDVKALAGLLAIHPRTVWRLSAEAAAGLSDFPKPLRLGPKTVRWRAAAVEAYLDRLAAGAVRHDG